MATELTSQERFQRMLERRDHDRVPRHDGYWPETLARWQSEGFTGDWAAALRFLGSDVEGVCWSWPVPFPGREEVLSENDETKVVRGNMGKTERYWKNKWGTPEHLEFGCTDPERWRVEYKPALLRSGRSVQPADAVRASADNRQAGKFSCLRGIESFEAMRQLVGDELLLPAMALEPEWVRDMSATYTDLILQDFEGALAAGAQADAVWVFGDVGYNKGPFFSPAMYRELVWPDHKRLADWTHARGMKFIYHTDGDVRLLLDLFVAAGFDCIQPMEAKANMDVRQLAPVYGSRLSFFGNIDMIVAIRGDRAELEHEVKSKLAAGMAHKGYAYHSDHSVPPGVSWPTYQFIVELLNRYGRYE